jgi:hypothetical protein
MKSIRNIALAIAVGGLLGTGAVLADDAKPADKPSVEKHEHGRKHMREKHGRMGEKHERMGEHGCPGMQQGRGGHDHS